MASFNYRILHFSLFVFHLNSHFQHLRIACGIVICKHLLNRTHFRHRLFVCSRNVKALQSIHLKRREQLYRLVALHNKLRIA